MIVYTIQEFQNRIKGLEEYSNREKDVKKAIRNMRKEGEEMQKEIEKMIVDGIHSATIWEKVSNGGVYYHLSFSPKRSMIATGPFKKYLKGQENKRRVRPYVGKCKKEIEEGKERYRMYRKKVKELHELNVRLRRIDDLYFELHSLVGYVEQGEMM